MTIKEVLHGVTLPDAGCPVPQPQARDTGSGAMTPSQILLYCGSCVALVVVGMALLMRAASVSPELIKRSETPQTAGRFAPIPMGGLYGTVTVL